jgi:transposase
MAKYIVRLTAEERMQLTELISTGRRAASVLARARILLKADASEGGPAWSDGEIAEAVETSLASVHRVRQACVEDGVAAALTRKRPTGRQYRKLDGAQEARLVALACSTPPEGRVRWTLQLLADRLVELEVVEAIGRECVRTTLKKMTSSRGGRSSG